MATRKTYTALDFCEDVLKLVNKPLSYQDILALGKETKFFVRWNSQGRTPSKTIAALLYVDVRDNEKSKFEIVSRKPTLFFLKGMEYSPESIDDDVETEEEEKTKNTGFMESKLHPLLTYFAYSNIEFNKGKAIVTKTIFHQKSKRGKGYNKWLHPDMVGFYLPTEEWNEKIMEFGKATGHSLITLYSFELKISLNKSNYREHFFQAVSNSSWSNESYLVATKIKDDEELLNELERLSQYFGIGVILLDTSDIHASKVLFYAKKKENLDWAMMNKLSEQNPDFQNFVDDVKKDYDIKRVSKDRYDKVFNDIEKYIKDHITKN